MVALPIERVRAICRFVMEAREKYSIEKYNSVTILSVEEIENGLNLQ